MQQALLKPALWSVPESSRDFAASEWGLEPISPTLSPAFNDRIVHGAFAESWWGNGCLGSIHTSHGGEWLLSWGEETHLLEVILNPKCGQCLDFLSFLLLRFNWPTNSSLRVQHVSFMTKYYHQQLTFAPRAKVLLRTVLVHSYYDSMKSVRQLLLSPLYIKENGPKIP